MENCSDIIKIDENITTLETIFYSLMSFFGLIFNTVALWVFCFRWYKWTESSVYMTSLAMADYMLVLTLPFIIYFHQYSQPTDYFCRVIYAVRSMSMQMSISNIVLIALDRYIAIKHPLKARVIRSPQKAAIMCLFFWLCCLFYAIILVHKFESKTEKFCFYKTSVKYSAYIPIKFTIFFFLPLIILSFCSIQVIQCLRKKQNASLQEKKLAHKAIRLVSVNMGTFILCFLPFHVSLLAQYALGRFGPDCKMHETFVNTTLGTFFLTNLNCCLDAICYYLVAKEFQEAASALPPFKTIQTWSNLTQVPHLQNGTSHMQMESLDLC